VGVQSNQFPRVMHLARELREAGVAVSIGGFHVSGCLAMLPGVQPDLQEAIDLGVSLFAGEAEGRFDGVLIDAANGALKPIYNYLKDLPGLEQQPLPFLPRNILERTVAAQTSFDSGRGCPFQCTFCTIINVQGRKSRRRSADDVERIVRANHAQDVYRFFITDDNFARNKDWKSILNRLIKMRKREKIKLKLMIQVDTLCHKIPGFIKKSRKAGVNKVFIGLESIHPEALKSSKKRQNQISDYREMLQAWHDRRVVVTAGLIIGFPGDTRESILRDVEIIKRDLPIDILEFFCLTPLPGSQDHKELFTAGVPMDPDMNNYDLQHVTTAHTQMSMEGWQETYRAAWKQFYTRKHMKTILRRGCAAGINNRRLANMLFWFHGCKAIEEVHPLEGGLFRIKTRRERRPGLPIEGRLRFYGRYGWQFVSKHLRYAGLILWLRWVSWQLDRDPEAVNYSDAATTKSQANA
jgi:radical SAM superfamily enzyme YgiQ (UPF0313 family)